MAGTLRAQMSVKGTATAPKASLHGALESLKVAKVSFGQANLTWDYADRRHTFAAAVTNGGKLKARGELEPGHGPLAGIRATSGFLSS